MIKCLIVAMVICLAVSACISQENGRSLIGSWKLIAYGPVESAEPAVPDQDALLNFNEDGSLSGDTGCNEFAGNYLVEGDQITFGQIVSTDILCPDLQMAQEQAMFQVLMEMATFSMESDTLTITQNGTMLVFEALPLVA